MSSREKILNAIAKAKPDPTPIPPAFTIAADTANLTQKYLDVLASIGGKGVVVESMDAVQAVLAEKLGAGAEVANGINELTPLNAGDYRGKSNAAIQTVQTVFLRGSLAVAENAAIWVPESAMVNRMLPFICQELVLVVEEKDILPNMHEAYGRIEVAEEGFGAFIAGPSKTADIEQSLVIGAHGPLGLTVFVLRSLQ